jgi:hypothetical protein
VHFCVLYDSQKWQRLLPYIARLANEKKCVYFVVRTESLNIIEVNQSIKNGTRKLKVNY